MTNDFLNWWAPQEREDGKSPDALQIGIRNAAKGVINFLTQPKEAFQSVHDSVFPNSDISKSKSISLAKGTDTFRSLNTPTIAFINKEMGNPDNAPDPNWASNSNTRPTIGYPDRQNEGMPPRYIGTGEYGGYSNNPDQGYPDRQTRRLIPEGDPELQGLSDNQLEDFAKRLEVGTGQAQPGGIFDRVLKEQLRRSARSGQQPYESYRGLNRLQGLDDYNQAKAQQLGTERMRDAINRSWNENEQLNKEGASLRMMGNTIGR